MAGTPFDQRRPHPRTQWRLAAWGGAALLLLLPLLAMQFTDEVQWDAGDFVFAGLLVAAVGIAFEAALRMTRDRWYLAGTGMALAASFVLVWSNAAVGIIGSEDNPANLMYAGVLAVGALFALLGRFTARGMARALVAMAIAQGLIAVIALVAGIGAAAELLALTLFFATLWLGSAWLFGRAATSAATR